MPYTSLNVIKKAHYHQQIKENKKQDHFISNKKNAVAFFEKMNTDNDKKQQYRQRSFKQKSNDVIKPI